MDQHAQTADIRNNVTGVREILTDPLLTLYYSRTSNVSSCLKRSILPYLVPRAVVVLSVQTYIQQVIIAEIPPSVL